MRVFEAAGSGLQNHDLIWNVCGAAAFSVNTDGMTLTNVRGGLAAGTTGVSAWTMTWPASRFGTIAPIIIGSGRMSGNTLTFRVEPVAIASNQASMRNCVYLTSQATFLSQTGAATSDAATAAFSALGTRSITGAEAMTGGIFVIPYSATGTAFTS